MIGAIFLFLIGAFLLGCLFGLIGWVFCWLKDICTTTEEKSGTVGKFFVLSLFLGLFYTPIWGFSFILLCIVLITERNSHKRHMDRMNQPDKLYVPSEWDKP